jgi:RNA polymerase sigma factor (sigma-70 family)
MKPEFDQEITELFRSQHRRLYRFLDRLSGEPDVAADIAQEAFVRMYRRGSLPDAPESWLISVALNLFRNHRTTIARRRELLTPARAEESLSDAPPTPAQLHESSETTKRVRVALDRLVERDRAMLLMHAEGYSYREIAESLELGESGIGTLLARAKRAFREHYDVE